MDVGESGLNEEKKKKRNMMFICFERFIQMENICPNKLKYIFILMLVRLK